MELIGLIPESDVFKMNIAMLSPFWIDWGWSFGYPLQQYNSRQLYDVQQHPLAPILNARWVLVDSKDKWVRKLHSI